MDIIEASEAIAAIANMMNTRPSTREFASICLFNVRAPHPQRNGQFSSTFSGPNARFTKADADYLCEQIQLRADLPDDHA